MKSVTDATGRCPLGGGTLRLTMMPIGLGPYERWDLTVEETGEIIAAGMTPMDEGEVRKAVFAYRARPVHGR